ncbi:MAG: IS1634 family transposase [Chloroflexi bacterium]|nr:IS1634 family transposase [Chloroflexota bacterium]
MYIVPMYVAVVPNRGSPPAILLQESYREGSKVKKRTLANLSKLPPAAIEAIRRVLAGATLVSTEEHLAIERSLPHGAAAAVVGMIKKLRLDHMIASRRSPERDRVVALVAARILEPTSRLGLARLLDPETATSTLGMLLDVEGVTTDQLYAAMDWLGEHQQRIEAKLAARHLGEGTLLLYDVTSTYFEGRTCPLAKLGHNRDDKKDKLQIVVGLLCAADGCPVGVEVYPGNTADPTTLASQIFKVRERWGLKHVVWVGDRGLLTDARIEEDLRPVEGLAWITALRSRAIAGLLDGDVLQLSLFDERDLFEFTSPDYPGERLVACKNPLLAQERARKREALLQATERELEKVAVATRRERRRLVGKDQIGLRVGKVLGKYKVGKHFELEIADDGFLYHRNEERIRDEARLDGVYVVRTSLSAAAMEAEAVVRSYKDLANVERAFRNLKTAHLEVRPIHHRLEERVRVHVFICMLAYYVVWHMRQALAPLLFQDDDPAEAEQERPSIVAAARRSHRAHRKAATKRTDDGFPVHSLDTLLQDLATLTRNRMRFGRAVFDQVASPTPLQQRAFDLLEVPWRA